MDRPYQPRFTNPSRHPNQSPNLSSTSSPASPIAYHHPSHHGSPYAPELKHHHHRPTKSFSSRNTPPPTSTYSPHGAGMDDRRYMPQPPQPPPLPPHHPPPQHPSSHPHRPPPMSNNDKRPVYPGERVPNPAWGENMDERFHDPRSYRQHEQPPPHPPHPPPQHPQHPLHQHHPPPHRDDRPVPPFHRQENATPPLSEGNSSGRSMINASPQMYHREHSHQREHPPRDHPRDHPREHHHPSHFPQQGPPPPPPYPNGPSLQSAQQQHHQLQQQLQQNGPPPPPGHHSGPPQSGPFPPQPLFSQPPPPQPPHPPPGQHHHQHQRSASYSEPHHQPPPQSQYHPSPHPPPNRPASTTNRSMPPPSPPHYSRAPQGGPPHSQNFPPPPPPANAPFGGGRDLPSISSLEIPREISRPSHMSLSSILGDAPPGPPVRLESLTQSVYRDPARSLGPDLSPLKRPYTPGDRPIGGHAIEPSRSNSPPMNKPPFPETRTPPFRPGQSISRPREPHFSPPTRPLSQPTFPPQVESQPPPPQPAPPASQPHSHPPIYHHQERIPERETFPPQPPPHLRQNHLRTSSYPDSPYQRQVVEPPRREPSPPRSVNPPLPRHNPAPPNISPPLSQQPPPQPQPHPSPSYHHPAPPTSSAASLSFSGYAIPMPESPFAITPGLSNQHTISSLHQYDNDRKKPLGNSSLEDPAQILADRLHEAKSWERDHPDRERSTDIPPLRAEEALVKGIHERKYPGSFANDPISQSPKPKREVIVIDEGDPVVKKDEDIEMGGVDLTHSPMKRAEALPAERAAKRRRGYLPTGSNLRSDSTLSNLEDAAASLSGTPVRGATTFTSVNPSTATSTNGNNNTNNLPVIPPPQVVDNSEVLTELKTHERHHLGSMVYTPTMLKKSGTVKSYSHIPLFMERENCTYIIRIPWYCLSLEERERVCKKRLLWGTEVYTDDSNILAVLVHLGYLPAVRDGAEVVEYASAHDAVLARLSAPKRRGGAGRSREIAAAVMAEGGAPKTSASFQERKDLLVKIVICGNLGEYRSVVKYGLKSRGWDGGHDGMGFMVENVKWVDSTVGFGDVRGKKGVHDRLKKWDAIRKKNDLIKTIVSTIDGKEGEVRNVGSRWLVKDIVEKKVEEDKEESGGGGGGGEMDLDPKEAEKEASAVVNGTVASTS